MSTTMQYAPIASNAAQSRILDSVSPEQCSASAELARPARTERHVTVTDHGFVILDAVGDFIAWCECPVVAKRRLDENPLARTFERCSDGVCMAWRRDKPKRGV